MGYFVAPDPGFGRFAWIFFVLQWMIVGAGVYLAFFHKDRFPYRQQLAKQMGTAALVLGGVGFLLGALRLAEVGIFNVRYWFYIQFLLELGVTGYIVYYFRTVYPGQMVQARAQAKSAPRRPTAQRAVATAAATPAEPRPVATTSRRDARRDRKRKGR